MTREKWSPYKSHITYHIQIFDRQHWISYEVGNGTCCSRCLTILLQLVVALISVQRKQRIIKDLSTSTVLKMSLKLDRCCLRSFFALCLFPSVARSLNKSHKPLLSPTKSALISRPISYIRAKISPAAMRTLRSLVSSKNFILLKCLIKQKVRCWKHNI